MALPKRQLCPLNLHQLPVAVVRPRYDRATIATGIVHLGIGAFHRAHQAVMTEAVLEAGDGRWGIMGASLRSPATRDALRHQDWLYTVASRDASGERDAVIGALRGVMVAPENPQALVSAMAQPDVKIVSLTVTEKGYCFAPSNGELSTDHADIVHDWQTPGAPKSALGFIAQALSVRRRAGIPPFTVLSCDNLAANGATVKRLLIEFAAKTDPDLARHIEQDVACPSTMVDRIVPATTAEDRSNIAERLGLKDASPVVTEPFCQWVIEDHFPLGRPDWGSAGAEFVSDVAPYELMKLRLLNASHSAIAYLGAVAGYATVSDAMDNPNIAGFVLRLMDEEVTPTLAVASTFDLAGYKRSLIARFNNPALKHRTQQIAMDGSQKLPPRVLGTVRARLAAGLPITLLAIVVAAWMRYAMGADEQRRPFDISDPLAAEIGRRTRVAGGDAGQLAAALLEMEAIFGRDLPADIRFRKPVCEALAGLISWGVDRTLADADA